MSHLLPYSLKASVSETSLTCLNREIRTLLGFETKIPKLSQTGKLCFYMNREQWCAKSIHWHKNSENFRSEHIIKADWTFAMILVKCAAWQPDAWNHICKCKTLVAEIHLESLCTIHPPLYSSPIDLWRSKHFLPW